MGIVRSEEVGQSDERRVQVYRYSLEHLGSVCSSWPVSVARSGAEPAQDEVVTKYYQYSSFDCFRSFVLLCSPAVLLF